MHSRHLEAPHVAPEVISILPEVARPRSFLRSAIDRDRHLWHCNSWPIVRSKTWPSSANRLLFPTTDQSMIEPGFRQFLEHVDGNDSSVVDISLATSGRGQPSRGRCSDIYCALSLSLFYPLRSLSSTLTLTLFFSPSSCSPLSRKHAQPLPPSSSM